MSDQPNKRPPDPVAVQRESLAIDTASGPGPILEQPTAPMPIFHEHDGDKQPAASAIDPAEFAALGQRGDFELDHAPTISDPDQPGVAARAAEVRPEYEDQP